MHTGDDAFNSVRPMVYFHDIFLDSPLDGERSDEVVDVSVGDNSVDEHKNKAVDYQKNEVVDDHKEEKQNFDDDPNDPHAEKRKRTLDAPDLVDDYYLNLLDWGNNNVLAIALGNTMYLWDASEGNTSELVTVDDEAGPVTSVKWAPDVEDIERRPPISSRGVVLEQPHLDNRRNGCPDRKQRRAS
ncbi:hypothetical protein L6452_35654 [Arctium lappa]|uniref:Uncharacterized protein n=1 Tax=Arctium lappa TaxID=4217 RepID=A0ACB8Y744_ARCLA|nr:hypothetical protein L6452_35654 [Arctium lappa]